MVVQIILMNVVYAMEKVYNIHFVIVMAMFMTVMIIVEVFKQSMNVVYVEALESLKDIVTVLETY